MNYNKLLFLVILIIIIILVTTFFSKQLKENFQDSDSLQIIEKQTGEIQSEFINFAGFENIIDPVNEFNQLKFMKFNEDTEFKFTRSDENMDRDFSLGVYFKRDKPGKLYANFIQGFNDNDDRIFNVDLDFNQIRIKYGDQEFNHTLDSFEVNENDEAYSYLFFKTDLNTVDQIPTLKVLYNNKEIVDSTLPSLTDVNQKKLKKFVFGGGFEGVLGQILIYNEIVADSTRCRYYNCNVNCFEPNGKSYDGDVNECIKDCMTTCNDIEKCQNICINCEVDGKVWDKKEKQARCPWITEIKKEMSAPDAPQIRGFPGDSKVLIEWKKPNNNGSEISNYVVLCYETFNRSAGANISISSKSDLDICEYEIKNLNNRTYYDIIVRGVNTKGIGAPSNVITLAPNGNIIANNNRDIFTELEDELQKEVDNTAMNFVCNAHNFDSIGHSLDFYDDDMLDIKSYIQKLK
jgi:hypothetical protein